MFKKILSVFVLVVALGLVGSMGVNAAPKGLRDSCIGKKIDNFNVILRPNSWSGTDVQCTGSRIFFDASNGGPIGVINWELDDNNGAPVITDCNGTDDGEAQVEIDEDIPFLVAIRLLGPKDSTLDLDCSFVETNDDANEELCIIDNTKNINRGTFTKISANLADEVHEEITYTINNDDWKIFQVWIMEWDGSRCF